jgi:dolichol-phosphate mannosyltransferase
LRAVAQPAPPGPALGRPDPRSQRRLQGGQPPSVSAIVVLPTYNEVDNITPALESLLACDPDLEVLVVDDASPDGTAKVAEAVASEHPGRIHLLNRPGKAGLGVAYRAGFEWAIEAGYDIIVQMDADGSHPADRIPAMLDLLSQGRADVVVGSRYVPGGGTRNWPLRRRLLSSVANRYARAMLGLRQHDVTAGFRAWRTDALITAEPETVTTVGYGFLVEMAARAHRRGLRCAEIPITFVDRVHGSSKMTRAVALEGVLTVWRLRRFRPNTTVPAARAVAPISS